MSRLAPGLIELNKGLDLNTAKIAAPEGTLLDMLNYEQVDFQGQKRIDGYVRYDGSKGSYIDDFLRVEDLTYGVGDIALFKDKILGIVVGTDGDTYSDIAVIDETIIPQLTYRYTWGSDSLDSAEQHYELLLQYNQVLRERTTDLPGPIAGLHWFRDRLYAVAAVPAVPGTAYPNTTFNGYPVLANKDGLVYLGTSAMQAGQVTSEIASFFVSRNEAQAKEELGSEWLYGWEFNHLGWTVPFENGVSLYGSLTSLSQNRQDVGVQGPTSIDGTNGSALSVSQGSAITGMTEQVLGWKNSDTPTTYAPTADNILEDGDGLTIYADAYISWDASTTEIASPRPAMTELISYPATNTVQVLI